MRSDGFASKAMACAAVAFIVPHFAGTRAQDLPASLKVRELVLVREDGTPAATLGFRDGGVVLELSGPEGAGISLVADRLGGSYVFLTSKEAEDLDHVSDIVLFAKPDLALVDVEAGSTVVNMGAAPSEGGFQAGYDERIEARIMTAASGATMRLDAYREEPPVEANDDFNSPVPEGDGKQVRVTVTETAVDLVGVAGEGK